VKMHCQRHDYIYRPKSLENVCLYFFFASVEKVKRKPSANGRTLHLFGPDHPLKDSHMLVKRQKVVVPVIHGGKVPNPVLYPEENAKMKLIYLKPFRIGSDLKRPDQSWRQALDQFLSSDEAGEMARAVIGNLDAMNEGYSQRDQERKERAADPDWKLHRQHEVEEEPFAFDAEEDGAEEVMENW